MAEQSDVVDRADTLMRRRRSFVATPSTEEEKASLRKPVNDDDDLPVLTEIVSAEAAVSESSTDRFDETLLSIIATDLIHSIENQLAIELPSLIEATLLNAQNELRTGVNSTLEMALHDFITRRKQLHLPLDDPNRGN